MLEKAQTDYGCQNLPDNLKTKMMNEIISFRIRESDLTKLPAHYIYQAFISINRLDRQNSLDNKML